jgi:hypothetical protein
MNSVGRFYIPQLVDVKDELNRAYAELGPPRTRGLPRGAEVAASDDV